MAVWLLYLVNRSRASHMGFGSYSTFINTKEWINWRGVFSLLLRRFGASERIVPSYVWTRRNTHGLKYWWALHQKGRLAQQRKTWGPGDGEWVMLHFDRKLCLIFPPALARLFIRRNANRNVSVFTCVSKCGHGTGLPTSTKSLWPQPSEQSGIPWLSRKSEQLSLWPPPREACPRPTEGRRGPRASRLELRGAWVLFKVVCSVWSMTPIHSPRGVVFEAKKEAWLACSMDRVWTNKEGEHQWLRNICLFQKTTSYEKPMSWSQKST